VLSSPVVPGITSQKDVRLAAYRETARALRAHHRHFIELYRLVTEVLNHRQRRHQRAGIDYARRQRRLIRKMSLLFPMLDARIRTSLDRYFTEIAKVAEVVRGDSNTLSTNEYVLNVTFKAALLDIQRARQRLISARHTL
jgi:hypothetical protein